MTRALIASALLYHIDASWVWWALLPFALFVDTAFAVGFIHAVEARAKSAYHKLKCPFTTEGGSS